ncbi:polyribonucleotide nucleotidyltransferase [Patescibacteria group bacterium]|nr:polyribonucleotide nucleotidyltransferase [Patescibacteria group bacterium]
MNDIKSFEMEFAGRKLKITPNKIAHQTNSSCLVQYGETVILATVVMNKEQREGTDFMPLMVNFQEKMYASGKIKGSRFIKRDGRPSDEGILSGRFIDRGIRPLFDQKIRNDIQIIITCLSIDEENSPDILGIIGASCVLSISDIPWNGPVAGIRIGYKNNEYIVNPSYEARKNLDLELTVSGTGEKITMIESGAKEISEDIAEKAFEIAMKEMSSVVDFLNSIQKEIGKEKINVAELYNNEEIDENLVNITKDYINKNIEKYLFNIPVGTKKERKEILKTLKEEAISFLETKIEEEIENKEDYSKKIINSFFDEFTEEKVTEAILKEEKRVDGRKLDQIRKLDGEVGLLPRTHGSAIFQRGETQVLSIVTLGSPSDEQTIDTMEEDSTKRYIHYYSDAPFSYYEAAPIRGINNRGIGHGRLAEKALEAVIPEKEDFPYTLLVVSEVMGSNGSSSMASICGSSLALMDAGVPIKRPVAGIAIGMANDKNGNYKILTDIQDMEDGEGGMDFKVGGSEIGITAMQMDTKTEGIGVKIIKEVLERAKKARLQILKEVFPNIIEEPRKELSKYAPRIKKININPEKIGLVIGPGGKTIKEIIERTGSDINIEDDGSIFLFAKDNSSVELAKKAIEDLTREFEIGDIVSGKVVKILDFGAFIELSSSKDGLLHISEIDHKRVNNVSDYIKVGDIVKVKVIEKDRTNGKLGLSVKQLKENKNLETKDFGKKPIPRKFEK